MLRCGGGGLFSLFLVLFLSLGFSRSSRQGIACDSDYGWSTWLILLTQSITIFICWLCVTARWMRPLLFALEHDALLKLPVCVNLKALWHDSAFQADVPWWRAQPHTTTSALCCKGKLFKRLMIMCKRVPCCFVQWIMTLLCAWPSMLLWLCYWKLSRYPASWLVKKLYSEEELAYFRQVIEPELLMWLDVGEASSSHAHHSRTRATIAKVQGLWLSNRPREELQRVTSEERAGNLSELAEMLREYDRTEATSKLEMLAEWPGLDMANKEKPWPLSICASALVLMEVWKGLVYTQQEVEKARKALWQAGQVAYLVDLLTNSNVGDRRSTQRVLVDLFASKKSITRISTILRTRHHHRVCDAHTLLQDVFDAAHAVCISDPHAKLNSTAQLLKQFVVSLQTLILPPLGEDELQWIRTSKSKEYGFYSIGEATPSPALSPKI
ncbi:hypothetical protein GOP47_0030094 [Adiantum capillus-veneris]|nr:hypothetical protein GOP47_0030094 [Adiantum capillus-veneris]